MYARTRRGQMSQWSLVGAETATETPLVHNGTAVATLPPGTPLAVAPKAMTSVDAGSGNGRKVNFIWGYCCHGPGWFRASDVQRVGALAVPSPTNGPELSAHGEDYSDDEGYGPHFGDDYGEEPAAKAGTAVTPAIAPKTRTEVALKGVAPSGATSPVTPTTLAVAAASPPTPAPSAAAATPIAPGTTAAVVTAVTTGTPGPGAQFPLIVGTANSLRLMDGLPDEFLYAGQHEADIADDLLFDIEHQDAVEWVDMVDEGEAADGPGWSTGWRRGSFGGQSDFGAEDDGDDDDGDEWEGPPEEDDDPDPGHLHYLGVDDQLHQPGMLRFGDDSEGDFAFWSPRMVAMGSDGDGAVMGCDAGCDVGADPNENPFEDPYADPYDIAYQEAIY